MRDSRKRRCCAAVGVREDSHRGSLVDQAAGFADQWYDSNAMPCGSAQSMENYHENCRAHVEKEMRCAVGAFTLLTIVYYLLTICYTVWHWRREINEGH